ncbi:hypothetical protein GA0070560_107138 [Micromonospora halophytica]|uniref:Uncharacterized protein n=1 Tax=Micromonospora halophytica TaxID=47864 RepID=A0A1C5I246_9ACTN|nr:hypothetical protein GA0070560_107138 [Micromonospora halophytica]
MRGPGGVPGPRAIDRHNMREVGVFEGIGHPDFPYPGWITGAGGRRVVRRGAILWA